AGAGNAEVTVTWPLVRMQIQPRWIALSMGDSGRFVVWGIMESGQWRDLTAQVTLTSSNPHAAVLEDVPVPGTVRAVGLGIATVVATDPISGLRSTDFDQAAAIYVTDGLARIDIRGGSDRGYFPARRVGESFRFTAIGVMADGSEQNFTQRCAWWSSDPAIAIAANQEGDRSRIDAVQLGTVRIGCRDPESQLPSNERDFDVIGALASIAIDVDSYNRPVRSGKPGWATAIGIYHPFADSDDHGRRNITQEVTWTSRDPGVAAMDNPEGARSRIDFVASGIARVYATDPVTGIVSYDGFVRSVGNPIALTFDRPGRAQVPIGGLNYYEVRGIYDGGVTYNLTRFAPEEYVLEAEDSSVAGAFLGGGGVSYIVGLKAGVTEIRARHLATGVVSAPQTLTVLGDLVAVALEPRNVLLGAGETHSLTGFGVYAPGVRFLATQELVYTSSNPAVVVATNEPGNRSRLLAVGPGTAVISATDPATGITSTTSGDDVTVEVLMGPPDRITIAPTDVVLAPNLSLQLTARAHWPDGRTTNVTQQVLWTSTAPAVVETPNVDRARSRLDAHLPGAARISALHPSGVRSTTSGSDVTVRVLATTTRALAPSVAYVRVGDTFRFTLIATLTDGSSLNLTQHAGYGTSNWNIAEAPNVGGDRSAYTCMSAGTVDVTATSDDLPGFIGPFYPVRATLICVP
ncbi:MAG TPA: hypothetical protein VGR62_14290, partial [Candidatus Binatia bacterium]|nr:hypothetical protein [Candidatus Binatia bacterium]